LEIKATKKIEFFQKLMVNKYLLIIVCLALLCFILSTTYVVMALSGDYIYSNIKVLDTDIGGLTKEKAIDKLNQKFKNADNVYITIKFDSKAETISLKDLSVEYDIKNAVEEAYKIGHLGNAFKRLVEIIGVQIKGRNSDILYNYDKEKLSIICDKLEKAIRIEPKDDWFEVKEHKLFFNYGYVGRGIDKEEVIKQVEQEIKELKSTEIVAKVIEIQFKKLSADSIPTEPKDATFKVENYRNIVYIKEQPGVIFDKVLFESLLKDNYDSKKSFSIAVNATLPKITVEDLKSKIFESTLSSFETSYASSPDNRKANVKLAASKIGNIILGPGDEFSYNKIVGPRTEDRGFKKAHVYSNGKIIDDFGGGICQVSTTLYNAVLKVDLVVTERSNHMFTVSYAQPGMDATVSYGIDDFKFKNNLAWPIKIIDNTTATNVGFTIIGTQQNSGKIVEFRREILKTIPYPTKEIQNSTLEEGKKNINQNGMDGYVVNVYKITKQNGNVVKEEFLHKDTYKPLEKIVEIGTKPQSVKLNQPTQKPTQETENKPIIQDKPQQNIKPQEIPVIQENGTEPTLQ